jgi:hypothetical protein
MPLRLHTPACDIASMNKQLELPQDRAATASGDLVEALTRLLTRARELESFGQRELAGLRLGEVVRIASARRDVEYFNNRLAVEISTLRDTVDAALAAGECARMRPGCSELFQKASGRPTLWRLQAPRKTQTLFAA